MDNFLFLLVLLSIIAFTKGHSLKDEPPIDPTVSSSVGSAVFIVLFACLLYFCCCRNKSTEGFTQFRNEHEGGNPRGRSRWRNRHFFRRNRNQNYAQNNPEPLPQHTTVIVQPVVNVGMPDQNPGESGAAPNIPSAPPPYNESMNNPHVHRNFNNPPMASQFMNPPMPSQFMNPPMPSQFMNPPMPSQMVNPPPMPHHFNNPPPLLHNPPPMPHNFNKPPPENPNASSYYTKY